MCQIKKNRKNLKLKKPPNETEAIDQKDWNNETILKAIKMADSTLDPVDHFGPQHQHNIILRDMLFRRLVDKLLVETGKDPVFDQDGR